MTVEVRGPSGDPPAVAPRAVLQRGAAVGRYLVVAPLGRGSMGEVYSAYDPELDRRVALKLLHTSGGTEQARLRLFREARALGKLSHPDVVQVYDVGEHDGDVFVAMELVDGQALDAWCASSPRPSWQEVLAAYVAAARGLAAAHEKGLVHRDVKPSNILRGRDGRVRVADFGLATAPVGQPGARVPAEAPPGPSLKEAPAMASADTLPAPSNPDAARHDRLTATGAVMGTPLYMAPEQFDGVEVGPAADQFSLCTALHEGLYGELPFPRGQGVAGIFAYVTRKLDGPPPAPPPGSEVPAWVYAVIARGLAPKPADRFPSMADLAEALARDPEARPPPRRRSALLPAIGLALAAALALIGAKRGAFEGPCAHPERQLAGAWDEDVRQRVRAAFLGTGRPYADDTAGRVERSLDAYTTSWSRMRGEVCEASRNGAQRRELAALRDECLDRRLGQVRALTALLGEKADAQVLDRAVQSALALPPVAGCADTEALTARVRPPDDPVLRARVAEVGHQIDRLEALSLAGKLSEGLAAAPPVLAAADATAHAPTQARVRLVVGELKLGTGDHEGAKSSLREAARLGAEGKDPTALTTAWARLLFILGERQRRLEEATVVASFGPSLLALARDARAEATWLSAEGLLLTRQGHFAEAKAAFDRALAAGEAAFGPDHLELTKLLTNLGLLMVEMGEPGKAAAIQQRALSIREKALGPENPGVALALNNLGLAVSDTGDLEGALMAFRRALAVWERALGPSHPHVGVALNNVANTLLAEGALEEARALYERALAIREKALGPDHIDVAQTLCGLGHALRDANDLEGSRAALARAQAISEKALGPDHADVAYSLAELGRTLVRLGRLDEAGRLLSRARALRASPGKPNTRGMFGPLLGLGELYLARDKPQDAVPVLEQALALPDPDVAFDGRLALAEALWRIGADRPRARALAEEARTQRARLGPRGSAERAERWLADHPG